MFKKIIWSILQASFLVGGLMSWDNDRKVLTTLLLFTAVLAGYIEGFFVGRKE